MLIKKSGCQKRLRLTEKLAKYGKTRVRHTSHTLGSTRRKANNHTRRKQIAIYASKNGSDKCISQQRIFTVRRLVQWWWTTRWDIATKNWPARDSLVWPDHFSVINIYGGRKTEKHGLDMRGYVQGVAMEEGLLSVWVSQSIGQSWSVNKNCYLLNSGFARTMSCS